MDKSKKSNFKTNIFLKAKASNWRKKQHLSKLHKLKIGQVPSIVPTNPLQLVSCKTTSSLTPGRTLEFALTSSKAVISAGLADLPIIELRVNSAPTFKTLGVEEVLEFVLVLLVLPTTTCVGIHKNKTKTSNTLHTNILPCLVTRITSICEEEKKNLKVLL